MTALMTTDNLQDGSSAPPETSAPPPGQPVTSATPQGPRPNPEQETFRFPAAGTEVELDRDKVIRYAQKGIGAEKAIQQERQLREEAERRMQELREQMTDYDGYVQFVDILRKPHNAKWWNEFVGRMQSPDSLPPNGSQPRLQRSDADSYFDDEDDPAPSTPASRASDDPRWSQMEQIVQAQNEVLQRLAGKIEEREQKEHQRELQTAEEREKSQAQANHDATIRGMASSEILALVPDQQHVYRQISATAAEFRKANGEWDIPLAVATIEQHYKRMRDSWEQSLFDKRQTQERTHRTEEAGSVPDVAEPGYVPKPGDLQSGETLRRSKEWLRKMGYKV